jgi:TrmH family RNA methyltransferase
MSAKPDWRGVAEDLRRTATRRGRAGLGCCTVEGLRLHERALRGGARIESALLGESFHRDPGRRGRQLLDELQASTSRLIVVPDEAVRELTDGREAGLVGLVRLPQVPALKELFDRQVGTPQGLLVGVEIEDPGNGGALARTALASGALALVAVGITDPWHPRAVRTSRGSVFKLPLPIYATVDALLVELDALGARTLGTVTTGGRTIHQVTFDRRPVAFFLGSEAFGLTADLKQKLESLVSVPMVPGVDSFSVNAAAAVVLYEFGRQTL